MDPWGKSIDSDPRVGSARLGCSFGALKNIYEKVARLEP